MSVSNLSQGAVNSARVSTLARPKESPVSPSICSLDLTIGQPILIMYIVINTELFTDPINTKNQNIFPILSIFFYSTLIPENKPNKTGKKIMPLI